MSQIFRDDDGDFKVCDRCNNRYRRRPKEQLHPWRQRRFCSSECRLAVVSKSQPQPGSSQREEARPSGGFVNPDGVWRPPGFPTFPGGIAS